MFNVGLFSILIGVSIPGLLVAIPRQLNSLRGLVRSRAETGARIPSRQVLIALGLAQTLLLVSLASAVGTALSPHVGLSAPFFESIVSGQRLPAATASRFPLVVSISIVGAILFLIAYYGVIRPRLDLQTVRISEGLRMDLGLASRLLYGSIVEEVLIRWGLMTTLAWVSGAVVGHGSPGAVWAAIIISGVLFGLGHLPDLSAAGARTTGILVGSTLGLNLWASVVFGWLYWQYGLYAAMVGHVVLHLVWFPLDRRAYEGIADA